MSTAIRSSQTRPANTWIDRRQVRQIFGRYALGLIACVAVVLILVPLQAFGQKAATDVCPRPAAGSIVSEPEELRSENGVLNVELAYRGFVDAKGEARYCYIYKDGSEAPTLRVKPGDLLILRLKNELPAAWALSKETAGAGSLHLTRARASAHQMSMEGECAGSEMTAASTNIHFHGLDVPPVCHEDDVLNTMVEPGSRPFEYKFRIPLNEPPGLYWYHPHVHGLTKIQVLGGASGALIVEGTERANTLLAGLPERVLVIRDEDLRNPDAAPVQSGNVPPPIILRDAEGDIMNTGTGGGKPAKDLTINFVPVSFPEYKPAVIQWKPNEKQLWRVLNSCAITYLDLQLLVNNVPQPMGVVSLDGEAINENGLAGNRVIWESHTLMPPAGRVEFVVKGFPEGTKADLVTRSVDTGPAGENDPTRPLATIAVSPDAPEPAAHLAANPEPLPKATSVWIGDVTPVRMRKLYFSEKPRNPSDPNSPTDFYITVEGQEPKLFDPNCKTPNLIVNEGDVEDWIVENRTQELHAFHIHQIHFMLLEWNGVPVDEPFLRDTVNVAYWDGKSAVYPSVKLRMDFRDPNIVGTFVYHCHLLEHEDGGMMGLIRVLPKGQRIDSSPSFGSARRQLCGGTLVGSSLHSRGHDRGLYTATNIKEHDSQEIVKRKISERRSF